MAVISGLFQIIAVALALVAVVFQIAAVAGNSWYFMSYENSGQTVDVHYGLFLRCDHLPAATDNAFDCVRCKQLVSEWDNTNKYCQEPDGSGPTYEELLPDIRGTQALAIMTILIAVANFAVVLLFVCDKLKSAIPAFIMCFVTGAGAIGTFIVYYTYMNNKCPKTFCERAAERIPDLHCVASWGPYLEMASFAFAFAAAVFLALVNRSRARAAAEKQLATAQPMVNNA